MLFIWLLLLAPVKGVGADIPDENFIKYTRFNATLPSQNDEKQPSPGAAFQVWYKGSHNAEDAILTYTLPSGPLMFLNESDVRHGFDISSAALLIYDMNANDAGIYHYVEGSHFFSVLLNVTELDPAVLLNSLRIKFNSVEMEIQNGALQLEVLRGDPFEIAINTTDIDGEIPRLVLKKESEVQNDNGSPGVLVLVSNTNTAGFENYTVEISLFDVVGIVTIEVIRQDFILTRELPTTEFTEVRGAGCECAGIVTAVLVVVIIGTTVTVVVVYKYKIRAAR